MKLSSIIKKDIKEKYPRVYSSKQLAKSNIWSLIYSMNFGYVFGVFLTLMCIVILYTYYIDFEALKLLDISFEDNVKSFMTAIITLVSMNLFVTNLLLTHLRDERDNIQSIIDRRVNFKFITYLGFSIIISILLLYFFSPNIKSENIKCNLLLFIFLSFIVYIVLLVKLYNLVFNFIHKSKRNEIVKNELHNEFYVAFYNDYYAKSFKSKYFELMMNKNDFKQYPSLSNLENLKDLTIRRMKDGYLKDININRLIQFSNNNQKGAKFFHPLDLGKLYLKDSEIKLFSIENIVDQNYDSIYVFSKKNCLDGNYSKEHLDKLVRSIDDNTLANNFNELELNLKSLDEIYENYITIEQ